MSMIGSGNTDRVNCLVRCTLLALLFTDLGLARTAAGAGAGGAGAGDKGQTARRPNLLVLCSDQQHWQAMGTVDPFFDTPAQDALARESVVFEHSFCTTPQCSPSRSSMLTGFYPHRTGVMGNVGATGGNSLKIPTVGVSLQQAGYTTGYFGKWHLGNNSEANSGWDQEQKRGPDAKVTERGVDFIQRHARDDRPFALFLMYLNPHDIYHFNPESKEGLGTKIELSRSWSEETFGNKPSIHKQFMTENQGVVIWNQPQSVWEAYHEFYRQKVRLYDDHVSKVLQKLKENGLWDNTVVVNTSDHGDMDTNHKLIFKGPFMYEHMMRVPTTIRVPEAMGGIGHRRVTDYDWVNVDLTPTLLDLAQADVPECHGQSVKSILLGEGDTPARPFVIGQYFGKQKWVNPIRMIRTRRYKLNVYIDHGAELYDLQNDPQELVNLADDPSHSEAMKRLRADLDRWIAEHDDPFYTLDTTPLEPNEWKQIGQGSKASGSRTKSRIGAQTEFNRLVKADWQEVFHDTGTQDWQQHWFLDGELATVKNTPKGMELIAGPEFKNDAHHMVLWTKSSFDGDLKIDYEYTRLDKETRCVNILYVQATGSGSKGHSKDIALWRQMRAVPSMSTYFNHMHTFHISYAAFPNDEANEDYIRARRYVPEANGLKGTDLAPDYFQTGLFETGVPHKITVIKRGQELFMFIRNPDKQMLCRWKNDALPSVTEGRVGLRHMYTRSARYRDVRISVRK